MERKFVLPRTALGLVAVAGLAWGCTRESQQDNAFDSHAGNRPVAGRDFGQPNNPAETPGLVVNNSGQEMERITGGDKVPNFAVYDIDGNLIGMEDYEGRGLMILFENNWQSSTIETMASLKETYGNKGLGILTVFYDEDGAKRAQEKIEPIVVESLADGGLFNLFGVRATPTLVIIDRRGIWVDSRSHSGLLGYFDAHALEQLAQKLISGEEIGENTTSAEIDERLVGVPVEDTVHKPSELKQILGLLEYEYFPINQADLDYIMQEISQAEILAQNYPGNETALLARVASAGKRLADVYCQQPDNISVLRILMAYATFEVNQFRFFETQGKVKVDDWPGLAANFKPNCQVILPWEDQGSQ